MTSRLGDKVFATNSIVRRARSKAAVKAPAFATTDRTQEKSRKKLVDVIVDVNHGARRKAIKRSAFGSLVSSPIDAQSAIDVVRSKLPTTVVSEAIEFLSLPKNDVLLGLRIASSSYHRKLSGNQTLSSDETERVMRLAEVTRGATEAFGGSAKASSWLITSNMALGGKTPLSLLDTDAGASQVRRVLSVVNYGGVL